MEKTIEPTLFDFTEEEQKQINTKKASHDHTEISDIVFAEKADWKNENGEEITLFLRDKKLVSQNVIYAGLSKNYDNHGHYNNSDKSIHGFFIGNERRTMPMIQAIAHPNEENIKNLTDDEREEFNFLMRNINPEYKKAYEDKLEQERLKREADAGKNATNYVLEKLKSAGIEVVSDKEEFNRILEREQFLQKMAETLTLKEQKRYFTFNDDETKHFKEQVDEWQADKSNIAKLITVGKIPPVMKVLGFPDNPIEIQHSTLSKAMRPIPQGYPNEAQGHALTIDDIYSIPKQLADPVIVFKSRTRSDSYVFFTERKDSQNRTVLIPMAVNKHKGRIVINEITSMYGRNNEIDFVKSNIDEENLIYVDKKRSTEWERSSHVQFVTQRLSNSNAYNINILTKERLVKFISADAQEQKPIQKMALASSEPTNIESLFVSKNEANLDSEIDKLTEKDVSLKDDFITISEKTPFIFKEFGLDDFPVNMYKQKLARAFFLEEQKFGERITHGHKGEFTSATVKEVFKDLGNPRYIFNSKQNLSKPKDFYLIGVYDELDEQKNPMVLSLHFNKNRKEIEANWITSIYGKRKDVLVNDWTQKGYLVYMNDLEMEKAPAEVVTLQMRVSKSASAYINNVKKKSDFVNDFDIAFNKNQENVYGFAYNGKIYINPDFLNSNVTVHEYTHLWDEYTRRTNPELLQKGMNILKDTKLFAEVKSDPNYADIAGDDNLVLSEVHARICGKLAQKYLEQIAKEDGEIKSISAYDWNNEVAEYVKKELFPDREIFHQRYHTDGINKNEIDGDAIERFLSTPMIDLAKGLPVKHRDFETRFKNGDFTELFDRLSDINFKTNIYKTMSKDEGKKEYEKLWSELFPDGEPKEIQEKREGWQQRIKEYEDKLKLPETLENTKALAKKLPAGIIKERLEQYKKDEYGFNPKTAEEAAVRNEAKFKDDILNRLGKQHNSYDHWLNWNNVFVWNHTEPVSNIATDIRISVLENELKERGISIETENQSKEKNMENNVKTNAKSGSEKDNSVDFVANGIRNLQEKNTNELIEFYNKVSNYTRLWNENMRKTNNKHWQNGMNILSKIAAKDGLEPTDLHVQICTDVVKQLIDRLAEENVNVTKDTIIDWDKEVYNYIQEKLRGSRTLPDGRTLETRGFGVFGPVVDINAVRSWFAVPIKNFMNGKEISLQQNETVEKQEMEESLEEKSNINDISAKESENMGNTKSSEESLSEQQETEKLYAEVNLNGGNDRGFQFGIKDLEHLRNIKRVLDDFEKNPPKHSELEDLEKSEKRYSRESKRLQRIYEKENDKDALKGAQKNADYANFYHWQVEKLNKDIIQHPNKFDSIKTWYEKAYPNDKEMVEKMSEYVVFGQLESDIENGIGYGQPNSSPERYGVYDSIVRERLFEKLSEMNNVDYDVIYDKWLHAGEEKKKQKIKINPVSLEEILDTMEVSLEIQPNGKYKLYDRQTNEYRLNGGSLDSKNYKDEDYEFSSAKDILENLDTFINDYYINDIQELLEAQGINIDNASSLEELCKLYKTALENGNKKLEIGELELAMGIVHPDSVIMPKKNIEQSVGKAQETTLAQDILNIEKRKEKYFEKQNMTKPMPLNFDDTEKQEQPFEIINNFNRINIKFDMQNKNPHFNEIIKELKANGWKFAPSKKQWYPLKTEGSNEFVQKLLEKYSTEKPAYEFEKDENGKVKKIKINRFSERDENQEPKKLSSLEMDALVNPKSWNTKNTVVKEELKVAKESDFSAELSESKNSPYDGIKFFDRNYLETEDFTAYFNKHIDSLGNKKPLLSENDAKYILRALNHLDVGLLEERTDRLGIDNKGQLVIFSRQKDDINITRTDLKGIIKTAKEMSEKSLKQAEEAFEKHSEKNILDDSLKSIFTKMYSDCVSQCKEVNAHMEEIFSKYNLERNIERKVKPLSVNDKIGNDSVVDVYNISDGVYQATLSNDSGSGIGSAQNYFIIDSQIAKKCRPEIIDLMENKDGRFVVENKNNEPYILKELISKNLIPPRDESFIQKLDDFIEKHPEKYAKLYPISSFNFSEKLNELANIDKDLTKNPLLCGKKLISLVNEGDKKSISSFLKRNGCIDDSSMKKVFSEWMKTPQMEKTEQIKIKKNDGYPPRGA